MNGSRWSMIFSRLRRLVVGLLVLAMVVLLYLTVFTRGAMWS